LERKVTTVKGGNWSIIEGNGLTIPGRTSQEVDREEEGGEGAGEGLLEGSATKKIKGSTHSGLFPMKRGGRVI